MAVWSFYYKIFKSSLFIYGTLFISTVDSKKKGLTGNVLLVVVCANGYHCMKKEFILVILTGLEEQEPCVRVYTTIYVCEAASGKSLSQL